MGAARSFSDILNEKMHEPAAVEPASEKAFSEGKSFASEAHVSAQTYSNTLAFEAFFSRLHNTVDAVITDISSGVRLTKTPYAQAKKPSSAPPPLRRGARTERVVRAERTQLRSQLNALETVALTTFVRLGAIEFETADIIGESLVKKAYRRLAVQLHPDRGASTSANFQALHEAYLVLSQTFKALPK